MKKKVLDEIMACIDRDRLLFRYDKDDYARYLLGRHLKSHPDDRISQLRGSPVGGLLGKPVFGSALKSSGNGRLPRDCLNLGWTQDSECFVLTLGRWGQAEEYRWCQTSRPGANLVLQLNLNKQQDDWFKSLTGHKANDLMGYWHPHSEKRDTTLAWSRIDVDFDTGEILIEEIQSDLVRDLKVLSRRAIRAKKDNQETFRCFGLLLETKLFLESFETKYQRLSALWSEAMMTATLQLCHEVLGFDQVYYHTIESCRTMKKIECTHAPRSLYSTLPKKFCFSESSLTPELLKRDKHARRRLRALNDPMWYLAAV